MEAEKRKLAKEKKEREAEMKKNLRLEMQKVREQNRYNKYLYEGF